jgi:hypothetical protein
MATTIGSAPSQQASPATGAVSSTYGGQKAPNPLAQATVIGGARWFYWIVGLSIINSLLALGGAPIRFVFGLGITQVFDAVHQPAAKTLAFIASASVLAFFALCGYFGSKLHKWPFLMGGILYLLDTGLCLLFQDYISVLVHAYVLFRIYQGFAKINDARPMQPGVLTA